LLVEDRTAVRFEQSLLSSVGWCWRPNKRRTSLDPTINARPAIVKSHNYGRDYAALQHLLALDLRYAGLLGPRRRRHQLLHALLDDGVQIDAELFAPAGLDLGAETPEEIALAIVSEIQCVFAQSSGASLRARKAPIHAPGRFSSAIRVLAQPTAACQVSPR